VVTLARLVDFAFAPRAAVALVLERGSALLAFVLMAIASLVSAVSAARVAETIDMDALFFAGTRQPWVQAMIDQLGPERTAVVLYLVQRSFDAIIVATAISPLFVWLLGSSAIHAAARLAGIRRPYLPLLIVFAYATALTLVPASIATLVLGSGDTPPARIATAIGWLCLLWLGVIAHRAIQLHYGVSGEKAIRILVIAIVLFYIVPLVFIVLAAVSIIIAAILLEYF
jgi:hypothetical protein